MKNKSIIIAVAVILIVVIGAILIVASTKNSEDGARISEGMNMKSDSPTKMNTPQAADAVVIQDYKFSPSSMTVKKGTTVTWTNQDTARHTVEMDQGQPAGGPADGPLFGKGETYSFTFNTVGTFNYHCSPHPYMKGTVVVTE